MGRRRMPSEYLSGKKRVLLSFANDNKASLWCEWCEKPVEMTPYQLNQRKYKRAADVHFGQRCKNLAEAGWKPICQLMHGSCHACACQNMPGSCNATAWSHSVCEALHCCNCQRVSGRRWLQMSTAGSNSTSALQPRVLSLRKLRTWCSAVWRARVVVTHTSGGTVGLTLLC